MQSLPLSNVWSLSNAQIAIEAAATVAFALSGLIAAARKRLDAVGVCVVAGLAAFGGGTLRDILMDRRPFFWVEHAVWLWLLLALCVAAMFFLRARHFALTERAMQWPDALGLGLFTAGGTQIALDASMPPIVAVLMGMVTAVFGGVLRDIVCNEIPRAFRDHQPYAVCSFAGAWVVVLAHTQGAPQWIGLVAAAATATLLRVLAIVLGWTLPAWQPGERE
ncbi:trimeric intracellular cation channel family protein [Variovorax sp. MHTC-1]|uniref:trimeric intracellular cation channel family protein n=1 Tax=Variovorax sp. MHTC-1 TaxID=2495593 RepID=UPI000F89609F|nr:trimeric intracellular cation channel family protein [Variovorax sp. MHTC-1]RST56794.1 trimeric intracellular cation channel family protein [Variovorax sp. MHTC-1]